MKFYVRKAFLVLFCVTFSSCCNANHQVDGLKKPGDSRSDAESICLAQIHRYVEKTRKWGIKDYSIIQENSSPGLRGFSVLHKDDVGALLADKRVKSFHVDLDEKCKKVVEELAYQ
ncbi:hypothetical protein PQU63_12345 [Xanthomonas protegens]|uniref:Lipoprotein n=1 Tax=Xanthomonas protegens TaxID=3380705 RepID=A0ABU9LCF8_9XANT